MKQLQDAFYTKIKDERYDGIKTADVIGSLEPLGWKVSGSSVRRTAKGDPSKVFHVARLKKEGFKTITGDDIELVISNSNDKKSGFTVNVGIFRLVCSNGLILGEDIIEQLYIPHRGYITKMIPDVIDIYLSKVNDVIDQEIKKMTEKILTEDDKKKFAENIFYQKHKDYEPFRIYQLLMSTRKEDENNDVWTVANVIQSHIMNGDYEIIGSDGKPRKARATKSPKEEYELNKKIMNKAKEFTCL